MDISRSVMKGGSKMRSRDKYLLRVALGIAALGLGVVVAKGAPKMKARMEGHCREMMTSFVEVSDREREGEPILTA